MLINRIYEIKRGHAKATKEEFIELCDLAREAMLSRSLPKKKTKQDYEKEIAEMPKPDTITCKACGGFARHPYNRSIFCKVCKGKGYIKQGCIDKKDQVC